jgi:hypothetical protein
MERPTAVVPVGYVDLGGRGPEDVVADRYGRALTVSRTAASCG